MYKFFCTLCVTHKRAPHPLSSHDFSQRPEGLRRSTLAVQLAPAEELRRLGRQRHLHGAHEDQQEEQDEEQHGAGGAVLVASKSSVILIK